MNPWALFHSAMTGDGVTSHAVSLSMTEDGFIKTAKRVVGCFMGSKVANIAAHGGSHRRLGAIKIKFKIKFVSCWSAQARNRDNIQF